jgi:hypothetical protein
MQLDEPPMELDDAPIGLGALERSGLLSLSKLDDAAVEESRDFRSAGTVGNGEASPGRGAGSGAAMSAHGRAGGAAMPSHGHPSGHAGDGMTSAHGHMGGASPTRGAAGGGMSPGQGLEAGDAALASGPAGAGAGSAGAKVGRAADAPLDLFAPPHTELDDALVELAEDELEWTRKRMTAPPGTPPDPGLSPSPAPASAVQLAEAVGGTSGLATSSLLRSASPPPSSSISPVLPPTPHRAPQVAPRIRLATQAYVVRSPRARFAAGVLLAIVLGFVPAHIVASLREDQEYRLIDARVIATQTAVDSQASYDALDAFRTGQLGAKRGARNTIALTALLIWAATGSVIAYVWFRRVPWARLGG